MRRSAIVKDWTDGSAGGESGRGRASSSRLPGEIIRRTIDLFNRDGPSQVSTNSIAADMGISPGNLHYHFRTRNDLSRALYDIMETDLRHALRVTDTPESPIEIVDRQIEVQRCLWKHRYFFAALDSMVRKDPEMLERFEKLQRWGVSRIQLLLDHYMETDVLRPIESPNSAFFVAQNTWMLWMSWVRWEVVASGLSEPADAHEDAVIQRLIGYYFSFLAVLMREDFAIQVARHMAERGAERSKC